jgi:pyridoxal phosphate enzyme (YggS family)
VTLVAVTKGVSLAMIKAAYDCGIRDFGENRVQEAEGKIAQLGDLRPSVTWHMIGHLQSNKVKKALRIFDIIHSIDSLRLAELLSRRTDRTVPILLQVNVSGEVSRSGFSVGELNDAFHKIAQLANLKVVGLMTIAPPSADPEKVRPFFRKLRELRDDMGLEHLSMGMSDDFEVAIEEGATMVRIGRAIFGERR